MYDIVVFISPKFTVDDKQKIAELMRTHEIETTTDPNVATAILEPSLKKTTPKTIGMVLENAPQNLTLADIAQIVVEQTRGEIFELKQHMEQMEYIKNFELKQPEYIKNMVIPEVSAAQTALPKKSYHKKTHTYDTSKKQFNYINKIRNKTVFNRTRHK